MEQNITFNKLLYFIQRYANKSKFINSYGFGNLVEFGKDVDNTTPLYPLLFVVPNSVEYNENTTSYGLSIFLADKLNDDLEGAESIISSMSMVMRDLISAFKLSSVYMDIADFEFPLIGQPFLERFNDVLAGVSVDFNFTVSDYMEICEIEEELDYTLTITADMLGDSSNNLQVFEYDTITGGAPTTILNVDFTADTTYEKIITLNPTKYYAGLILDGGRAITSGEFKVGNEILKSVNCSAVFPITTRVLGDNDYTWNITQSYDCPLFNEIITEGGDPITAEDDDILITE